jgi:hypothetical protein
MQKAETRTAFLDGNTVAVPIDLGDFAHVRMSIQGIPDGNERSIWLAAQENDANSTDMSVNFQSWGDPATPDGGRTAVFNLDDYPEKIWIRATGGDAIVRFLLWGCQSYDV